MGPAVIAVHGSRPSEQVLRPHFAGLDGLRGIAAAVVLLFHCLAQVGISEPPQAFLAVDFFFVLSGFVLAHAYGQALLSRRMTVGSFVKIRFFRLHPMIVLAAFLALAGRILQHIRGASDAPLIAAIGTTLMSMICVPYHFIQGDDRAFPLNPSEWSLLAEYLVNILYAAIAAWLTVRRTGLMVIAGLMLSLALIALNGTVITGWSIQTWPLSLVRAFFPFFAGILIGQLHRAGRSPAMRLPWSVHAFVLIAVLLTPIPAGFLMIIAQLVTVAVVFPAIVAVGAAHDTSPSAAMTWAGEISYPLYIVHFPVIHAVMRMTQAREPTWMIVAIEMVAAVVVAQFALALVDRPLSRYAAVRRAARASSLKAQ